MRGRALPDPERVLRRADGLVWLLEGLAQWGWTRERAGGRAQPGSRAPQGDAVALAWLKGFLVDLERRTERLLERIQAREDKVAPHLEGEHIPTQIGLAPDRRGPRCPSCGTRIHESNSEHGSRMIDLGNMTQKRSSATGGEAWTSH